MMYTSLLLVALFVLATGLIALGRSFKLGEGRVTYLLWGVGFAALYLGGGGLWSLLRMSDDSYEWAVSYYEVSVEGVFLAALAWACVLLALPVAQRLFPTVLPVVDALRASEQRVTERQSLAIIAGTTLVALLAGYATGNLGYMGQRVGSSSSEFEVNPFFDSVLRLYPAVAAVYGRRIFDNRFKLGPALVGLLMLALVVPLGRRVFIAAGITALAVSYLSDSRISAQRLFRLGGIAAIGAIGLSLFFNLRVATYTRQDDTGEMKVELQSLLPEALLLTFGESDKATAEIMAQRSENEAVRPFYPYGFLVYCAQGYGFGFGNHGMLTLGGLAATIPRALLPSKDAWISEYGEEEIFVQRDFALPQHIDESPTLPTSGLINGGMLGVLGQVFLLAMSLSLSLWLLFHVRPTPLYLIGAVYLLYSLQLAESSSNEMFLRVRTVGILVGAGLLLMAIAKPRGRHIA